MTARSRCLTPAFAQNLEKWTTVLPGYSLLLHDDAAVERFIRQDFALFPHFTNVWSCVNSGAARADLWRYLMLWEHGGLYTDLDNVPTAGLQNGTAIDPADDAWFPIEGLGVVSQFLFAAAPQHPVLYTTLEWALHAIWNLDSIRSDQAPFTTGPRATKNGVIQFLHHDTDGYLAAGIYYGLHNRSITIVGDKRRPREFVNRNGISNKTAEYATMGMVHFSQTRGNYTHSCRHHVLYNHVQTHGAAQQVIIPHTNASSPMVLRAAPILHCGCQDTCTPALLHETRPGMPFGCGARIEFLMDKYGISMTEACTSAVENQVCDTACDPRQCH